MFVDEQKVLVVGAGLMGTSLALACEQRGVNCSVWTREAEDEYFLRQWRASHPQTGIVPTADWELALEGVSLLILCVPPEFMAVTLRAGLQGQDVAPDLVVTDVGSVKSFTQAQLLPVVQEFGLVYVGSHPMAGAEVSGFKHGRANLFDGAVCALCPNECSDARGLQLVEDFWQMLEMRLLTVSAREHDRLVGRCSHLPHLAAAALIRAVMKRGDEWALAGPGLRDSTRVASSQAELWVDIVSNNSAQILAGLEDMGRELEQLKTVVEEGDREALYEFLRRARELRLSL